MELSFEDIASHAENLGILTEDAASREEKDRDVEELAEAKELAALADRIDARRVQQEFPKVQPCDLNDGSEELHAQDTLRFIRILETVEIESYLDHCHCCQECFEAHPVCIGTEKMAVRMARWKRDVSYTHIHNFS